MFFIISKLLGFFFNPSALLSLIVLANGLATLFHRRKLALGLHCATVAFVVIFGVLPGTNWLAAPLESRFASKPPLPDKITGIIVLGGTERVEQSAYWQQPTLSDPGPIAAMLMLARRYPDAKLVFSGGGYAKIDPAVGEASVVRDFVEEVGGDGGKILYEARSRNTHENVTFSLAKVHPKAGENWILVCQAIGMPRAVGVFRREGWQIIPFPAGYLTAGKSPDFMSFPLLGSLGFAGMAIHEWVGLVVYRLMGYTDALFPR